MGASANAFEPDEEGITDAIMSLRDSTTDVAASCMFTAIVTMYAAADRPVRSGMLADTCRPLNLLNAHASAESGAEVTVIHWRDLCFRDEVGSRFGA